VKSPLHHKESTLADKSKPTKVSSDRSITLFTSPPGVAKGEQKCSPVTVIEFLQCQGRTVHRVLGDGNCMFRSLSHQVYGTEDEHQNVRLTLQQVLEENLETYEKFWIQTDVPFSVHVQRLKNQGVWGTHVELLAAIDHYQIPVCICMVHVHGSSGKLTSMWHMFNSQPSRYSPSTSLRANLPLPFTKDHIELAHTADHYDSVVPCTGDRTPLSLPHIISKESDTIILE
jgi:hypothetical protein